MFTQTHYNMKLLSLLIGLLLFSFFAQAQKVTEVDQMPYFSGCAHLKEGSAEKRNASNQKVVEFVQAHLTYPDSAKAAEVEGVVLVKFVIDRQGKVQNPTLLYDIGYGCGEEALRIVRKMPDWEPATRKGQPVAVELEMPIRFEFVDESKLDGYRLVWGDLTSQTVKRKKIKSLLKSPIFVLTDSGEKVDILELRVAVVRHDKIIKEKLSDGKLNKQQKKMLRSARSKSLIELIGTVQQNGKFYYIRNEVLVR